MSDQPPSEHRERIDREAERSLDVAVLTISDTRTMEDDASGRTIAERVAAAGHRVASHEIVPDELEEIRARVRATIAADVAVLITNGGTGIAKRDSTIEAIRPLLDKEMDGFGELFRMLSFDQVGSAAMLSRAVAGVAGRTLVFTLPGSTKAVELALDQLIVPDLPHLAWETVRR